MEYLDFDIKLGPRLPDDSYSISARSATAGEASGEFNPPLSEEQLENFILKVGITRRGVRHIHSPQWQAAQAFGEKLFNAVFKDQVGTCFVASHNDAFRKAKGLRLRLGLQSPDLANWPWEFLYDPGNGRFLSLVEETPVIRSLERVRPVVPLKAEPPLRVLVVAASPKDYDTLDIDREQRLLSEALSGAIKEGLIELDWLPTATIESLRDRLLQRSYHIFHFIGHGGYSAEHQDGLLVFEREDHSSHEISGDRLAYMLENQHTLRLAVLNACEGARTSQTDLFAGTATTLLRTGNLSAVIAMQFEISDTAALEFARGFYSTLAMGRPVDAALAFARQAIFLKDNDIEWATPSLYLNAPDGVLFDLPGSEGLPLLKVESSDHQRTTEQTAVSDQDKGKKGTVNGPSRVSNLSEEAEIGAAQQTESSDDAIRRGLLAVAGMMNGSSPFWAYRSLAMAKIIVALGLTRVADGVVPEALVRGLEKATSFVIGELRQKAREVQSKEELAAVIGSVVNDEEIGRVVAETFDLVGRDGVIDVTESYRAHHSFRSNPGMRLDQGFASAAFITHSARREAVIEKPKILVTEKEIPKAAQISPLLERLKKTGQHALVIIAQEVGADALATLLEQNKRGYMNLLAVNVPDFGLNWKELLQDIAILTGAKLISKESDQKFEQMSPDDLGQAGEVISSSDETWIIDGDGRSQAIHDRITELQAQIKQVLDGQQKEALQKRVANLAGAWAVIEVGASSSSELALKKRRMEEGISIARLAIESGLLPADGQASRQASDALKTMNINDPNESVGRDILRTALRAPSAFLSEISEDDEKLVRKRHSSRPQFEIFDDAESSAPDTNMASQLMEPASFSESAIEKAVGISKTILTRPAV